MEFKRSDFDNFLLSFRYKIKLFSIQDHNGEFACDCLILTISLYKCPLTRSQIYFLSLRPKHCPVFIPNVLMAVSKYTFCELLNLIWFLSLKQIKNQLEFYNYMYFQWSLNAKPLLNQEFYFTFVYTKTIIRYNLNKFLRSISSYSDSLLKTPEVDSRKGIESGLLGNSLEDFCAIESKLESLKSYHIHS